MKAIDHLLVRLPRRLSPHGAAVPRAGGETRGTASVSGRSCTGAASTYGRLQTDAGASPRARGGVGAGARPLVESSVTRTHMIGPAPAGKGSPMRRRRLLGLLGPLAPARFLPPRAAAVAGCLLLLVACGGPRPGLAVSLASDALQVLRGGQVTVEVTLTRLGDASGDVTLEVSGLPTKVQGTFSPTVLSGDELTSTL